MRDDHAPTIDAPPLRDELRGELRRWGHGLSAWPGSASFAELLAGVGGARVLESVHPGSTSAVPILAVLAVGVAVAFQADVGRWLARGVTVGLGLTLAGFLHVGWLERTGQQRLLYGCAWSGPATADKRPVAEEPPAVGPSGELVARPAASRC